MRSSNARNPGFASGNNAGEAQNRVAGGVVFWLTFCVLAVVVRGVRWDENYEFAQVLLGYVPYPAGHPLFRYVRGFFSFQTYLTAALLWLTHSAGFVCGLRNVLFLAATVLPVYLLTSLLTRKAVWAHAATALVLQGILLRFGSSYRVFVWPTLWSNGHIGMGYALLTLYFLARGNWRVVFLLLGLMPCVHLGQFPAIFGLAALFFVASLFSEQREAIVREVKWLLPGLVVTAFCAILAVGLRVPPPTDGAYFLDGDTGEIWAGFIARDAHRAAPGFFTPGLVKYGPSNIPMAALLFLGAMVLRRARLDGGSARAETALWGYGLVVAATVWGVMLVHGLLGDSMPYVLINWMPYRLARHIPPVLLAVCVGALAGRSDRTSGAWVVVAAVAFGLLKPLSAWVLGDEFYSRYVAAGDCVLFLLAGAASGALLTDLRNDKLFWRLWAPLSSCLLLLLALHHQFGACCVVLGIASVSAANRLLPLRKGNTRPPANLSALTAALCVVAVSALLWQEWRSRAHLPASSFDHGVVALLDERGEPDAMLVARPYERLLQARTGHPVLVEAATSTWPSYRPTLGPATYKVYRDVYGIRFEAASGSEEPTARWQDVWANRTQAEWQALAHEYGFRYVVAPQPLALDLNVVVEGPHESLYKVHF